MYPTKKLQEILDKTKSILVKAGRFVAGGGEMPDREFPFVEGLAAKIPVGGEEAFLGAVEVAALGVELLLHVDKFAVGQEVAEAPEEGEGALVDDGMGAACIKAGDDTAILVFSKRELCLVAVTPRLFHADDRLHGNLRESADAA